MINSDETQTHPSLMKHVGAVALGLGDEALSIGSDFELACAINAYVHHRVERAHNAVADSGVEVLDRGSGVCGSMVLAVQELLNAYGHRSSLAYSLGGDVAHSMVVAHLPDGDALLDPYHGLAFVDLETGAPRDLDQTVAAARSGRPAALYVRRRTDSTDLRLDVQYAEYDEDNRVDFAYPKNFTNVDNYGVAGSGFVDFVQIDIRMGQTLGNPAWAGPLEKEPSAYSALAHERKADGTHLSWAYLMGQTGVGYHIQPIYNITGLTPGEPFKIAIKIATAYAPDTDPRLSLSMVGEPQNARANLNHASYDVNTGAGMQNFEGTFVSPTESCALVGHAHGEFVLNSIQLRSA